VQRLMVLQSKVACRCGCSFGAEAWYYHQLLLHFLQSCNIFIKEVLEFLFGEHGIYDFLPIQVFPKRRHCG
jgi:hypothetical protein